MENERRHCGFEAPVYGTLLPKGTKLKKNPDGTVSPIYPKEKVTVEKTDDKKKKETASP